MNLGRIFRLGKIEEKEQEIIPMLELDDFLETINF